MTVAVSPLERAWRNVVRALEWFTIALFAALVLDVLWGVISRYVPGIRPSDWTEELAVYLLVWVSLLGGALTYRDRGHLGVDYLVAKFDPAAQRLAGIVVELAVIVFAVIALCWGGWLLVSQALASGQLTPVLQWRMGLVYVVVPLSGIFFVAFSIEHLLGRPLAVAAVADA
ncbi:MAG TPA: TRAP transporter small permease [Thermoanaerobaculia bacterium]|nr:TRAP transporter small permease [Thermoanaerobaculia bacterium]